VSLATVYNTLHQFIEAGLLREVVVNSGRFYFDTNVSDHHHFFFEDTGRLLDIPGEHVAVSGLPKPPAGGAIPPHRRDHPRRPEPASSRRLEIY
jgi:Fur family iron response transcriptional regulator